MGRFIYFVESEFFMDLRKKRKALENIKLLSTDLAVWETDTFEDAMKIFGWETKADSEENIVDVWFKGKKEYLDDDMIFESIAQFVKCGSYIQMLRDNNYNFGWFFDGFSFVVEDDFDKRHSL